MGVENGMFRSEIGSDLKTRAAHPHQEFRGVPPPPPRDLPRLIELTVGEDITSYGCSLRSSCFRFPQAKRGKRAGALGKRVAKK